jgi:pyruvate dehydrogenase E1 component alpha subunit
MAQVIRQLKQEQKVDFLRTMLLIRRFEEKAQEMYTYGKIRGFLHLYIGQEAVAVGAINAVRDDDYIVSHYREHGHALVRGIEPRAVMAELFAKATGCSGGKGGSMHLFDVKRRFMGGYAIVGGHMPLSVGLALACQYQNNDSLVLCFFGDGAVNQGEFHESLNLASVWKLPVIFLCENNLFAMGTAVSRVSAVPEIYKRASAYDMPGERIDGMDVLAIHEAVSRAAEHTRSGQGPVLLEAMTYRFRGHSMADPELYRSKEDVERWRGRDPIMLFRQRLYDDGSLTEDDWKRMEEEIEAVVEDSVRFADESPEPPLEALYENVYA